MGVRKYKDVPRVYLDMDGPLADFDRAIIETKMAGNILKGIKGAFRNLNVVPGAKSAVFELLRLPVDVWVMTKCPDGSTYAASEKQAWLKEHFPVLEDHIILTPDKGAVGTPKDALVDDHFEWANAKNFPGNKIVFKSDYEEDGSSTNNWEHVLGQLTALYSA